MQKKKKKVPRRKKAVKSNHKPFWVYVALDEEGRERGEEVEECPHAPEQQQGREDPAARTAGHVDHLGVPDRGEGDHGHIHRVEPRMLPRAEQAVADHTDDERQDDEEARAEQRPVEVHAAQDRGPSCERIG